MRKTAVVVLYMQIDNKLVIGNVGSLSSIATIQRFVYVPLTVITCLQKEVGGENASSIASPQEPGNGLDLRGKTTPLLSSPLMANMSVYNLKSLVCVGKSIDCGQAKSARTITEISSPFLSASHGSLFVHGLRSDSPAFQVNQQSS